jgi:uncharacterized membrane protein YhaH (DUF805 family)
MNNYMIPAIMIAIAVLAVLFAVIAIVVRRGEKREPDYRTFFILGIAFLPVGIATDNPGLWGMGAVFLAVGLVNRDKWKDQPKWPELSPAARRFKLIILIGLAVLLLATLFFYLLGRAN